MHTAVRVLLAAVAALVLVLLLAFALLRWLDWNAIKDELAALIGERLGTKVEIAGALEVHPGLRSIEVRVADVRLAGTLPAPRPLLAFDEAHAQIRVAPLFFGNLELGRLSLSNPRAYLLRNAAGEVNWDLAREPEPEEPLAAPVIDDLDVRDGRVTYRDAALDEPLDLIVDRIAGALPAEGTGRITGTGRLESRPVRLELRGQRLKDDDLDVAATLTVGDATLGVTGTVARPDLRVDLRLPRAADLSFLPIPAALRTADVTARARVTRDRRQWLFADLEAALGAQRLTGHARLDADLTPPALDATLRFNRLDWPARGDKRPRPDGETIPASPFATTPLRQLNARVDLRIDTIANAPVPIGDIALVATLQDRHLSLRPLSASVARGRVQGAVEFDARPQVPVATARLTLHRLDVGAAVSEGNGERPVTGTVDGRIDLRSAGADIEKLLGRLDGQVLFVMREGSVTASWVEALDLDLAETVLAGAAGAKTAVRCALIAFDAKNGVLRPHPVVIDTSDSTVTLDGLINLAAETLDLTIRAYPKDASPLSGRGPVGVKGSFAKPSIDVLTPAVAGRGAAALALGALLGPIAALLPLVEPGLAEDRNCGALLADTSPALKPRGGERGKQ